MSTVVETPMEARVARLEARTHRLRAEIEAMKVAARFERNQRRLNAVYVAFYAVISAALIGVLSASFGWI